jgi:hypothetical protein
VNTVSGSDFETCFESGLTGLVGTVSVRVIDNDGADAIAPSTADIIETPAGSGIYCANRVAPVAVGQYTVVWSEDGSFGADAVAVEDLVVVAGTVSFPVPPMPAQLDAGPQLGPCSAWTTSEVTAECCASAEAGSDASVLDTAVMSATQALFELSGRQFSGVCERTVRPCDRSRTCGVQRMQWGTVIVWDGSTWKGSTAQPACSCGGTSRVLLPGYPVREIGEVKLDGDVLDPGEYRLDEWQYLTRLRDVDGNHQAWPSCQAFDLPDDEPGTFSVRYFFGSDPPQPAIDAAGELACQIYLACQQSSGNAAAGECRLPSGVTRITRQNVEIQLAAFRTWGYTTKSGWRTGLPLVDLFLNTYNPNGLRRRPAIWSPDAPHFASEVGTVGGS